MSRMRVIQVGVGGMGRTWLRAVFASDEAEYAAWVDVDEETLERQAETYGFNVSHCYTSLDQALSRESADGLINVTPPQFHEEISCAAFRAGLHVLSEKPLADTMPAATRTVECAEKADVLFMVAQNYRYRDFISTLKSAIASNRYGPPGQTDVAFYKGPHFSGFREEMAFPLIIDMSIHHFDLMRHILDADPVNVIGRSWNPHWSWFRGDASVALTFEFANGVQVVYHGSWCATGDETSWSGDWRIECERGVIVSRNDSVCAAETGQPLGAVATKPMARAGQDYLLHEFYLAVTQGITPATHGRDNLKSLGMVSGAVEAVRTGQTVRL